MLILEYISTHGTPEWCAARMSARASKGPLPAYEQLCTSCTGLGSTRGQRDPLQLVEHSGDAAGIMPAIANVDPTGPRDAAPSLISAVMCVAAQPMMTIFRMMLRRQKWRSQKFECLDGCAELRSWTRSEFQE